MTQKERIDKLEKRVKSLAKKINLLTEVLDGALGITKEIKPLKGGAVRYGD